MCSSLFPDKGVVVNRLAMLLLLASPLIASAEEDGNELLDFM